MQRTRPSRALSDSALHSRASTPPVDIDKLPFAIKWDYIGLPSPPGNFPSPKAHPAVAHPFSRTAASQRLSPLDEEDGIRRVRGGALTLEEQCSLVSPKGCTKRQSSWFRDRPVETGSSIRFLQESASAVPERLLPPGHLDKVTRGLDALNGPQGPMNLTKQRLEEMSASSSIGGRPRAASEGVQSSGSPSTSRPRRTVRGRLVALSEFSLWCSHKFGSTEAAWEAICGLDTTSLTCPPMSAVSIGVDDFAAALTKNGYPMGDLAARNLFSVLDSSEQGVIMWDDVETAIDSVAIGKTVSISPVSKDQPTMSAKEMDPFEAIALQGQGSETSMEKARAKVLQRLMVEDPPVGQFMEYCFASFKTLRMAFRQMDLNGNGSLTYSEFVYSMQTMRDNKGVKFIDAHMKNLFDRLDVNHAGHISIDALMQAFDKEEGTDPMIQRLGLFLAGEAPEHGADAGYCLEISSHAARREKLRVAFKREYHGVQKNDDARIAPMQFCGVLKSMHYPEWHVNDLFSRLDKDCSGQLSIGEFTAFLVKDIAAGKPKPKPVVPLGNEERRKAIEGGHSAAQYSTKLAHCGFRSSGGGKFETSGPLKTNWRPAETIGLSMRYERPDHLAAVREGLQLNEKKNRPSELRNSGVHVFSGNPQRACDLTKHRAALEHFDEISTRTNMDVHHEDF